MNRIATILCVLVFSASVVFAQDMARAIVEKAIQAQGGEAKVAKLKIMRINEESIVNKYGRNQPALSSNTRT